MNLFHAFRRLTGLHPLRRKGEPHYDSTADVIAAMRADGYARRHDDTIDNARAAFALAESRAKIDRTVNRE